MTNPYCPHCHDRGWVWEAYYSEFDEPVIREVACPDCNASVVPMTLREAVEFVLVCAVLVCAVLVGLVALAVGS